MRLLVLTPIFPNRLEPQYGPYNRQQLKALTDCGIEVRVLCAIPHVPGARVLGVPQRAARLAALDESDSIDGLATRYLRRLYVPAIGVPLAVPLYVGSFLPHRDLARWSDVVLGTWAYPDGCAAVLLARAFGKPCVVKVHGSDVNVLAKHRAARPLMRRILPRADAVVTVSRPMGEKVEGLGVPKSRIHLVANGVDRAMFGARGSRTEARLSLGLDPAQRVVLFVGRIEPQKGIAELFDAFDRILRERAGVTLALVGDGVWRDRADAAARDRFRGHLVVAGSRPHREIAQWMTASDVVTLPSHHEGTPNVLLEALAIGRPAVATDVGGIPDVLADPRSGIVVPARNARALAAALFDALDRTWSEEDVRACGPVSWNESAAQLARVLSSIR